VRRFSGRILIPAALLAFGAAIVALALAADLLSAYKGLGRTQIALLALGVIALLSGLVLATRPAWTYVAGWHRQLRRGAEPAGILLLAAWFGLLTGWGQALVFLVRKEVQRWLIGMGLDYGWMIPLANLVSFLLLGLALALLHKRWPRLVSLPTATFLLAWLAILGLLLLVPRISPLALLVLAAGIAAQLTRLASRHNRAFSTLVRFSVGWPALLRRPREAETPLPSAAAPAPLPQAASPLSPTRRQFLLGATAGIAAVALGTHAGLAVAERRALARLVRPTARMPNVLLIVLDTVRAQSMSLYGYSRPTTPNLERLATQGTLFTRAIAPSSWTLPSHASMFTGRFPHEYAYGWAVPVATRHPFLAEILYDAGYTTAGFVANTIYCGRQYGLQRGIVHYEDYRVTVGQALDYTSFGVAATDSLGLIERFGSYRNFGRKSAEQVNRDFLRWLSVETRRPFFAFLNYFDAHDPYLPPASFGLQFANHVPRGFVTEKLARDLTGEGLRELRDAYDGSIAYLDHQLGTLFEGLAALGVLDDTVVVITSDHGEQFGEHHLIGHGNCLYRSLIHVPLLLLWPGQIPRALTVREPVGLTDVPATMIELAGIPRTTDLPGRSLARYWHGSTARPEATVYSEVDVDWDVNGVPTLRGLYRSLVSSEYHYVIRPDGKEEIYSFDADLGEVTDLAQTPTGHAGIERLRALLPQI
jgi:arylsulfatase A-like enzyme